MTEKRYKIKCHEINSWHIEKDGKVLIFDLFKSDAEIIYNELNSLVYEIEWLKKEMTKLGIDHTEEITRLEKENEQLKQKYNELKHKYSSLLDENYKEVVSLEDENEQLKQKNNNLTLISARIQVQNDELRERNNRQVERLDELYSLIENKDWKRLTKLIDEMNKAEELNQLEFKAYGDKR